MSQKIAVVHGSRFATWQQAFDNEEVFAVRFDQSEWILDGQALLHVGPRGIRQVDRVIWRLGVVRPSPKHRLALQLIASSNASCSNNADFLLSCFDRMAMLRLCQGLSIPVQRCVWFTDVKLLRKYQPQLPIILKIGNYQGGEGKWKIETRTQWQDFIDGLMPIRDPIALEPFIDYEADYRLLIVADKHWVMTRKSSGWRANVNTQSYQVIESPAELTRLAEELRQKFDFDAIGVDILRRGEQWTILEINEIPGFAGFPEALDYYVEILKQAWL